MSNHNHTFSRQEKRGVYRAIHERRDIRKEFLPKPISPRILMKLLNAAHHAGSVGFMQPWNFIVIKEPAIKQKVKKVFQRENQIAARNYTGDRRKKYLSMKLEGILEAPLNLCITCDSNRNGPHILGRNTIPETDTFSTCCAIQNLWLAARAEGIGMGWVSILNPEKLRGILKIPKPVKIIAYLCLGYVRAFAKKPMLEQEGWEKRISLGDLVFYDSWNGRDGNEGLER